MEIRPVRPDEHEALGAITLAAYLTVPDEAVEGSYRDELLDVGRRAADAVVLVAADADGLIGGVAYVPGPESALAEFDDRDAAGIRMLAVDPARRGTGAGAALTRACVERAAKEGRRRVVLHSTPAMTVAHGIYDRLGFRRDPARDWSPEPGVQLLGFVLDLL